jgi:hypothetical protein
MLLEQFAAHDRRGAVFTASLQIVLYADQPLADIAKGAIACHALFLKRFGDQVDRYQAPKSRSAVRFTLKKAAHAFAAAFKKEAPGLPEYRAFHGSSLHDFLPPLFATGAYARFSWLQLHLPPAAVDDLETLTGLVTELTRAFPFRYGTVGPSLCWNETSPDRSNEAPRLIGSLLKRHPGFNIGTARELCDQPLPPVNWLTLVGPDLVKSLGGVSLIRRSLADERISVLPLPRGALIRAGKSPQLGDRKRKGALPLYRKVGRLLGSHGGHQQIELDGLSLRESKTWLARFDG